MRPASNYTALQTIPDFKFLDTDQINRKAGSIMHRFPIGDAAVTQLTELDEWLITPSDWYPKIREEHLAYPQTHGLPAIRGAVGSKLIFAIRSYIIDLAGTVISIDTCSGNHRNRPFSPDLHMLNTDYLTRLEQVGFVGVISI